MGCHFLLQGNLPNPGLEPMSPTWQADSLPLSHHAILKNIIQFSSVHFLSRVRLFATTWTAALQASLSITNSWSLSKLMSIELVLPSNHFILCRLLLLLPSVFPSIRVFFNESALCISDQSIGASASTSVLPLDVRRETGNQG